MRLRPTSTILLLAALFQNQLARADRYERLEGEPLGRLARGEGTTKRPSISFREIEALPNAFSDNRSALLVIKTSEGNISKLLVSPAFRKTPGRENVLKPVLLIERLETFERGKRASRLVKSQGLTLFNDFRVDLDGGQIVPRDEGEDLIFTADKNGEGLLKTIGKAELWTVNEPLVVEKSSEGPSEGRAILASDFNGRYHLEADGRFKGLLELIVADDKQVTGQFRSEPNGTSYPLTGQVSTEIPNKVTFTIRFPRVEQEFDGYLSTEGKSSLAGTFLMENRTFGFHAERQTAKD